MATKIEWTDETWNPIRARNRETGKIGHFCVHHSPGCQFCYAERLQARFGNPVRYAAQDADKVELFLDEKALTAPLHWRRPRMVFVCSMTDLFLEAVPDAWIDKVFATMALAPQHTFQVLTKRAERMQSYLSAGPSVLRDRWFAIAVQQHEMTDLQQDQLDNVVLPLPNVWLGVSVEDQQRADERIPHLLDTPAAVRFLSVEPLLGPVDLTRIELVPDSLDEDGELRRAGIRVDALRNKHCESGVTRGLGPLDWVIVGGESGPKARPMHPQWAREIRDQCRDAGVPFFFKQWGEWLPADGPSPEKRCIMGGNGHVRSHGAESLYDDDYIMKWAGKKRAGRLLDGREWNEVPA